MEEKQEINLTFNIGNHSKRLTIVNEDDAVIVGIKKTSHGCQCFPITIKGEIQALADALFEMGIHNQDFLFAMRRAVDKLDEEY